MKKIILIILSVFFLSECEISESNRLEPGTSNKPTITEEKVKNREEQRTKEEQLTDEIINDITIMTPMIIQ
jgi:hypothetical protein